MKGSRRGRDTALALESFAAFFDDYIKAETDLLAQIRAERQK